MSEAAVPTNPDSPFERIRNRDPQGREYWKSRDLAVVLEYTNYRNFLQVIEKARLACLNSGNRLEDHFVEADDMVAIDSGAERKVDVVALSRYACYLVIQNADPTKEIVAQGQTYFAIQTRWQELTDQRLEEKRRVLLREEMRKHNAQLANTAKGAGVIHPKDYAIFQDHGYIGLPRSRDRTRAHFRMVAVRRHDKLTVEYGAVPLVW